MTNAEMIARLGASDVSKVDILHALSTVGNHVVLFNALLAAARREWGGEEAVMDAIISLFDRADSHKRVAMGSTLRTLVVFALGKLRHPDAPSGYQRLKLKLDPAETDSLAWLERDAPADIRELFEK